MKPSKIDEIIASVTAAELTRGARFFSADYDVGRDAEPEAIILKFAEYGPGKAHLAFRFQSDCRMTFWATPNRFSEYQYETVFSGLCPGAAREAILTVNDSLEQISRTIDLYATTRPWMNYEGLLDVWAAYSPVLHDSGSS